MRQLNNVESNQVNGALGLPESIAAYLPTSMPSISMPAMPSLASFAEVPALTTAHPYITVAVAVGTLAVTYLGYRCFR